MMKGKALRLGLEMIDCFFFARTEMRIGRATQRGDKNFRMIAIS